jgi:cytoskeletal protein CcmA (bactofilin family)
MFKKENVLEMPAAAIDFIISVESVITGDIKTKSNIRVYGEVKGDIRTTGDVTVGTNAKVDGNISGRDIQITGVVNGNIQAAGELALYPGGKLTGSVKAAGFSVQREAKYEGLISIGMDSPKETAKPEKPEPATVNTK